MTMPTLSEFKRGDTFQLACTHKVNDVATSVTGFAIASQIRDELGSLVATLTATLANQSVSPGLFYLSPSTPATTAWPTGRLQCDIQITSGGVIRSTVTFAVPVVEDITK
ncbi:MAG: hypothetical protein RL758_44 [Pseudomonadota bacterium]